MTSDLSDETWALIRHAYEHTDQPVEDICRAYGISSGTLRDRMRRWHWTRRRPPVPAAGPPPVPPVEAAPVAMLPVAMPPPDDTPPHADAPPMAPAFAPTTPSPPLLTPTAPEPLAARVRGAMACVLPAIETIVSRLAAGTLHPREQERAARALTALTRTLRELNGLSGGLPQPAAAAPDDDPVPRDMDEFRRELARRIRAFVADRTGMADGGTEPQGPRRVAEQDAGR